MNVCALPCFVIRSTHYCPLIYMCVYNECSHVPIYSISSDGNWIFFQILWLAIILRIIKPAAASDNNLTARALIYSSINVGRRSSYTIIIRAFRPCTLSCARVACAYAYAYIYIYFSRRVVSNNNLFSKRLAYIYIPNCSTCHCWMKRNCRAFVGNKLASIRGDYTCSSARVSVYNSSRVFRKFARVSLII